ncbi:MULTISPECIES: hypothetical protein [unclassified Bradyrhizobium]|uniref:hypothetical protein n=1 Tax=unclassified Bradyrhizobium TaxID=2631580 RepID=UPI00247A3690|nr:MULTISPECIES: hypothetical protein [unclassified Bradyrhizobium]WGR73728.1 hypothetical protein MTX24_13310 [Bradyrhizobium sp. ISRA426]WGR78566.1 hypothetical protein MTX21_38280 [Bradyrhizobium sp. ISRA430]WGR88967.1 hypothetical protein MTX25_13325 [Bradyrhizobium sp. ISRA432]
MPRGVLAGWKPSIVPQHEGDDVMNGDLRAKAEDFAAEIFKQPNPLDSLAQSYQGGAVVALDFTPEVERPKAARSTCPTTT